MNVRVVFMFDGTIYTIKTEVESVAVFAPGFWIYCDYNPGLTKPILARTDDESQFFIPPQQIHHIENVDYVRKK